MRRAWGLAGAMLLLAMPLRAQDNATAIATRASQTYRSLTSIRASFEQVIEDRMLGPQRSKGELAQSGNALLAMRFSEPAGDAIVLDGTHAWLYTPSTTPGQVIRSPIPSDPVYGPNVLARILDKPAERYAITLLRTDVLDGTPVQVLEFRPNTADPLFRRAVIWFDRESRLPKRLELDEMTGVRRILTLSRVRANAEVPRREFTFQVPPGVRVVDR